MLPAEVWDTTAETAVCPAGMVTLLPSAAPVTAAARSADSAAAEVVCPADPVEPEEEPETMVVEGAAVVRSEVSRSLLPPDDPELPVPSSAAGIAYHFAYRVRVSEEALLFSSVTAVLKVLSVNQPLKV